MPRRLTILSVLALVLALGWWAIRSPDPRPDALPADLPDAGAPLDATAHQAVSNAADVIIESEPERFTIPAPDENADELAEGPRVLVLDANDAPVPGVELSGSIAPDPKSMVVYSMWSRTTNADGMIAVPLPPNSNYDPVYVAPNGPTFVEAVAVQTFSHSPGSDPVILRLPATGSLAFHVPDNALEQLDGMKVMLKPADPAAHYAWFAPIENGRAQFDRVALDREFEARCVHRHGDLPRENTVTLRGPTQAGQTVVTELSPWGPEVIVAARIVRPNGAPVTSGLLRGIEVVGPDGSPRSSTHGSCRVSEDGRTLIPLRSRGDEVCEFLLTFEVRGAAPLIAHRTVAPLPPGLHDLGTIQLDKQPVSVRGKVVDDAGQPVKSARITAHAGDPTAARVHIDSISADRRGRFTIPDDGRAGDVRLSVSATGRLSREVTVARGTHDLEVVLQRPATVTATVLPVSLLDPRRVALTCEFETATDPSQPEILLSGRGFTVTADAGTAHVRLRALDSDQLLYESPRLTLTRGETVDLGEIDLSERLHRIRVRAIDASGQSVPGAFANVLRPDGTSATDPRRPIRLAADGAEILAAQPFVDIEVLAPGHPPKTAQGVSDGQVVSLEPGTRIQVSIPASLTLPPGIELTARLHLRPPRDQEPASSRGHLRHPPTSVHLLSGGAANPANVPGPGAYVARFELRGPDGKRLAQLARPIRFKVEEIDQSVTFDLTQAEIDDEFQSGR